MVLSILRTVAATVSALKLSGGADRDQAATAVESQTGALETVLASTNGGIGSSSVPAVSFCSAFSSAGSASLHRKCPRSATSLVLLLSESRV